MKAKLWNGTDMGEIVPTYGMELIGAEKMGWNGMDDKIHNVPCRPLVARNLLEIGNHADLTSQCNGLLVKHRSRSIVHSPNGLLVEHRSRPIEHCHVSHQSMNSNRSRVARASALTHSRQKMH